jgi:hypothetical protein
MQRLAQSSFFESDIFVDGNVGESELSRLGGKKEAFELAMALPVVGLVSIGQNSSDLHFLKANWPLWLQCRMSGTSCLGLGSEHVSSQEPWRWEFSLSAG